MPQPFPAPSPPPPTSPPAETAPAEPRHLHAVHPGHSVDDVQTDELDPAPAGTRVDLAGWVREAFAPNSGLYTDRQPSIAEGVRRAREGDQLADKGPLRTLAIGHGYLAAANKAVCQTWVWVVDHPARLIVFGVLVALAIAFPFTRHLISALLTPVVWVQQALD